MLSASMHGIHLEQFSSDFESGKLKDIHYKTKFL